MGCSTIIQNLDKKLVKPIQMELPNAATLRPFGRLRVVLNEVEGRQAQGK